MNSYGVKQGRPTAETAAAITRNILDAATEIFLAEGFERTSMDAVATRAGVPRSTLYKRYSDKTALLKAVIGQRVRAWSEVNSRKNWMLSERLDERLEFYATWLLTWATEAEVQAVTQLATHAWPDDAAERYAVLGHTEMIDYIALDIKTFAQNEFADAYKAATTFMAMLSGILAFRSSRKPLSDAEASEHAGYLVGIFCNGRNGW